MLINSYLLEMAETLTAYWNDQAREAIRQKSPFHAKALAYFDQLNADERYWR